MHEDLALRGVRYLRRRTADWIAEVGRVALLLGEVVSVFTGAVAAVQAAYQFSSVVPLRYIGSVILRSVTIELGPVLTALIVGGRVGSSIAAELGTMKVTEQIDALRAMAINPVRFLVVPRLIGSVVMLPIVTVFSNAIAIFGGFIVAVTTIGVSSHTYVVG